MIGWTHYNPVEIHAGLDCRKDIGQFLPKQGKILLVSTKGMQERGQLAEFAEYLTLPYEIYTAHPEPDLDVLDDFFSQKMQERFDCVIAVGGGSVIDSAKALACAFAQNRHSRPLSVWLREKKELPEAILPLIAIPTTAGTGSEVTNFATIWDRKNMKKCSLSAKICFPKIALLDPFFSKTLPWKQTVYGALDSFSHALESLWNKHATPLSLFYAQRAMQMVMNSLHYIEHDSYDMKNRCRLQEAAMLAGIAISQNHSSISHSISYPLTLHYQVPHGLACSAFLLPIFELVLQKNAFMVPLEENFVNTIHEFLTRYKPYVLIRKYCSLAEAQSKISEMFTPERAGTFVLSLTQDDVLNILKKGYELQ